MIKETKTANKKSFKKYLVILALLALIILITIYCKEQLVAKLAANNIGDKERSALSEMKKSIQSSATDNSAEQIEQNTDHSSTESLAEQAPEAITFEQNKIKLNNQQLNIVKNDKYIIDAYLNYLKSVNHITVNLLLDKPYTNYLNQLNIEDLPKAFALLIEDLREYNEHYLIMPLSRRQIFPLHWPIIQKFIRIDENSAEILTKAAKKADIIKRLDFWLDYCYTEDFKTKFNKQKD